jgi:hypothetical protein
MIAPIAPEQIRAFATAWFQALDVHAPIGECFSMLAENMLHMNFPDADIRDHASFKKWYDRVINSFFDEKHTISDIEILSSTEDRTKIKVVVRWQAIWCNPPAPDSQRIDLEATQRWALRPCSSAKNPFGLEIVDYSLPAENLKLAPGSAKLPPNPPDAIQELTTMNESIGEAEKKADAEFLKTILSDYLRFRRANGTIVDKAIYLDDLMKPGNTTDELHSSDINAKTYGNLAVVDLVVGMKGMRCGNKLDGSFRNVRLFLKEAGKQPQWQLHFWFNVKVENP